MMSAAARRAIVWRSLFLLLVLGALVTAAGCTRREPAPATAARTSAAADTESFSVYELPGEWRDQSGAPRSLASLRGAPVLLALVYTHCSATCPLAVAELKRVAAIDRRARLVLVSLDPERDDPARLARYANELGLDPARWTLLTGSDAEVRDLAATLGVRFRRVTAEDLAHSNLVTILDSGGRIVGQASGRVDDAVIAGLR
ncbi:MAG TPA: SCO family protein [Gemmatimonadaceae bacterium]|nr:SCO family protein [Gemmatimonadaceae bacterium]